ncbi:unnamed protein product [Danaus chrysippus]|uniref:(African queen) hypothetical protein n=1 Tax=Danaus chrysippus TaxID=151541 RepID=A0A8J2QVR0_9NEOP|nr:unnamed protein product [Danaus chrysippus]
MADLDDFFAKKDRKKSKSVKKFATADELAKKLEDSKQKSDVRPKKDRPQEGEEANRAEEEWKDYEEPVKDYTGLKIQVLQGGATPDTARDAAEDSAPENTRGKGPWNKPVEPVSVEQPAAPPVREEREPAAPAAYVPPQSRNRAVEPRRTQQHRKNAPDIHNDDYFPVLGAARGARAGWGGGGGAPDRQQQQQQHRPALSTGNRFTSLQDS